MQVFSARDAGAVAVHLLDRGLVAAGVATGSALLSSQVLFGEFLSLTHINRECRATAQGTDIRTWPATQTDLRATRSGTGTREGCHECWMRPPTHPGSPAYLRHYAPVAAHLQVSAAVDEFFDNRAALRAGHPGYTLGLPRLLTLSLQALDPVDASVFADVANLLVQQQHRLAAWDSRLRVQLRSRRLQRSEASESLTWVRIPALDTRPRSVAAAAGVLLAIAAAVHLELIDGGPEGRQLLALVPAHLVPESVPAHLVPESVPAHLVRESATENLPEHATDTGRGTSLIVLTPSAPLIDVAVIKAALALDPATHPIDPELLADVRATPDQVL